ncbi:MAG: hypothetical protein WBQ85_11185 [Candidatus Sulfotelmatobacter sp.]
MHIAVLVLDVLTIVLALCVAKLLLSAWLFHLSILFSIGFALVWYAYARHPVWLDGVPPVLVDLATFGLAYLGGQAINPPAAGNETLKRVCVFVFALLFVIGMAANGWQRSIESNKQARLQQNETDARIQFSGNLQEVKKSNEAILKFVANPPKGFTPRDVLAVVERFLNNQQSVPNEVLRAVAIDTVRRLRQAWLVFDRRDATLEVRQAMAATAQEKQAMKDARAKLRLDLITDNTVLFSEANYWHTLITKRLGIVDTDRDWVKSGPDQFITNMNRLVSLAQQLPQ